MPDVWTQTDEFIHLESSATGFEPTMTPKSGKGLSVIHTPKIIRTERPATGFESGADVSQTTYLRTQLGPVEEPLQSAVLVTTERPMIVSIHTEVDPAWTTPGPGPSPEPQPGGHSTSYDGGGRGQSASIPGPGGPQPTSTPGLLDEIVSIIGTPLPHPQATVRPTAVPTGGGSGHEETLPVNENTLQPTVVLDQLITIGPATLTLTPGLSTTVGSGSTATLVAMTTNTNTAAEQGQMQTQTIIVVSSSGTAVTATVAKTPVTYTYSASSNTFAGARITTAMATSGRDERAAAATSTSSKGGAAAVRHRQRVVELDWLMGAVVGGFGAFL
jgi:hypothetical protein